jgi:L,D-peptidoglycan transpeptidase YkuD (ErfK/YbiS/YcfS/YnhG family)
MDKYNKIILTKNKQRLKVDDFYLKCSIGKKGTTSQKVEGDNKTPKGNYAIGKLYFRKDQIQNPITSLKTVKITKNMGWCDDIYNPKNYNKLTKVSKKIKHEKLYRKDDKYNLLIPIKYNYLKPKIPKGSCIFLHLTKDYKPTAGCIALKKKDFLILIKLINKNTRIIIH